MPSRRVKGFTLLEVLISLVVIAFGLLGVAGLQVMALKNNQTAAFRNVAILVANDMIDRMKSNYQGVISGNYHLPAAADYTTAVANCTNTTGCTASDLANNDASEWSQIVAANLPGGLGVVCLDSTPDDGTSNAAAACDNSGVRYVIKVWWLDDRSRANIPGALRRLSIPFNP
jgi:type IV pilus assembly protein PilV